MHPNLTFRIFSMMMTMTMMISMVMMVMIVVIAVSKTVRAEKSNMCRVLMTTTGKMMARGAKMIANCLKPCW